ncbi:MAG: phosphoribosyltransferase [Gammaproteobacteria bacterium]|nr:phosphoribosyltransferase [Gammaproteobacteria bacterium]
MITSADKFHDMPCELVTWEKFNQLARQLGRQIIASGMEIDMIVAIGRGGYMPGRILSDLLGIMNLATFKIEHYQGSRKSAQAVIKHPLNADVSAQNVLLVDDVSDSGDTFSVAIEHIRSKGAPKAIHTGALHHKSVSRFVPDYFAEEVKVWRWIIYPWAVTEDLAVLIQTAQVQSAGIPAIQEKMLMTHGIKPGAAQIEDALLLIKQQN